MKYLRYLSSLVKRQRCRVGTKKHSQSKTLELFFSVARLCRVHRNQAFRHHRTAFHFLLISLFYSTKENRVRWTAVVLREARQCPSIIQMDEEYNCNRTAGFNSVISSSYQQKNQARWQLVIFNSQAYPVILVRCKAFH